MLLKSDLARLCPRPKTAGEAQTNWDGYVEALTSIHAGAMFADAGITTARDLCGFLANVAEETGDHGGFTCLWENLNFSSVAAIRGAWGKRASGLSDKWIKDNLIHNPQALGEWAYGGRMGNAKGNGDGYKYRGFGPMQTTGKADHRKYLKCDYSHLSALWAALVEWRDKGCSEHVNGDDFEAACILINGGRNGLKERQTYYAKALTIWTDDPDWGDATHQPDIAASEPISAPQRPLPVPSGDDGVELGGIRPNSKSPGRIRAETAIALAASSRKWLLMRFMKLKALVVGGGAAALQFAGVDISNPDLDQVTTVTGKLTSMWARYGLISVGIVGVVIYFMASKTQGLMVSDTIEKRYTPSGAQ